MALSILSLRAQILTALFCYVLSCGLVEAHGYRARKLQNVPLAERVGQRMAADLHVAREQATFHSCDSGV